MARSQAPKNNSDAGTAQGPSAPPERQKDATEDAPRAQVDYGLGASPPDDSARVQVEAPKPRCEALDDRGRQCKYEQHSKAFEHLFDQDEAPKIAAGATGQQMRVSRQSQNAWWCPNCDNAQQQEDRARCRKCGTVPLF